MDNKKRSKSMGLCGSLVTLFIILKRSILSMENKILNILIIEDDVAACRELRQYIEKIETLKLIGIGLPFSLFNLPATSINPKAKTQIINVIQIGENTHSHDQEITSVIFNIINSVTKLPHKPILLLLFLLSI